MTVIAAVSEPAVDDRHATTDAELLRKVRRIEITTRRLVDRDLAGDYHSAFKGRGVEFSEVRPYQPGDDIRSIDWNVTARMDAPYVKEFTEERDLTVFLVVDVSGSLSFGSRSIVKRELAAEIAALLSFAAIRNGDRVGAALVGERVELLLPPRRRRNHALHVVREILGHAATGGTDLESGLEHVVTALHGRAVLFVISDFVEVTLDRALEAAASRHDTILLEIRDPHDVEPPRQGPVLLRDAETGRIAPFVPRRDHDDLTGRRHRCRRRLMSKARRLGVDHVSLGTREPYLPSLAAFFARRRRRLRR